jgi:hypothetical protein
MNKSKVFFAFLRFLGYDTIVIISYIDREGAAEVLKNSSYLLEKAGLSLFLTETYTIRYGLVCRLYDNKDGMLRRNCEFCRLRLLRHR